MYCCRLCPKICASLCICDSGLLLDGQSWPSPLYPTRCKPAATSCKVLCLNVSSVRFLASDSELTRFRAQAVPLPFPTVSCVVRWPCFPSSVVFSAAVMQAHSGGKPSTARAFSSVVAGLPASSFSSAKWQLPWVDGLFQGVSCVVSDLSFYRPPVATDPQFFQVDSLCQQVTCRAVNTCVVSLSVSRVASSWLCTFGLLSNLSRSRTSLCFKLHGLMVLEYFFEHVSAHGHVSGQVSRALSPHPSPPLESVVANSPIRVSS